jgi:hypothetical protein
MSDVPTGQEETPDAKEVIIYRSNVGGDEVAIGSDRLVVDNVSKGAQGGWMDSSRKQVRVK